MSDVIDISEFRAKSDVKRARISVSLRNVSRECRRDILGSYAYHSLISGQLPAKKYARLLYANLKIRESLEAMFDAQEGTFHVVNMDNNEQKFLMLANMLMKNVSSRSNFDRTCKS